MNKRFDIDKDDAAVIAKDFLTESTSSSQRHCVRLVKRFTSVGSVWPD